MEGGPSLRELERGPGLQKALEDSPPRPLSSAYQQLTSQGLRWLQLPHWLERTGGDLPLTSWLPSEGKGHDHMVLVHQETSTLSINKSSVSDVIHLGSCIFDIVTSEYRLYAGRNISSS